MLVSKFPSMHFSVAILGALIGVVILLTGTDCSSAFAREFPNPFVEPLELTSESDGSVC